MKKPYVIAEAGVNYYDTAKQHGHTPLEEAKYYAQRAKESGIDAIKFQTYKANTIVSKQSPAYWDTTKEPTKTQYELFLKFDAFGEKEYGEISSYCKSIGIDFISTPFDDHSADYLADMLSVGASYLSEVEESVRVLLDAGCPDLTLMHCVLSYPCKNEDANLGVIPTLKRVFPELHVGYSDHTLPDPTMTILTTAYLLGAEAIEKHFTLDKRLPGNDHYHAGDPEDFAKAIENFRLVDTVMGSSHKTVFPCELVPRREARRSLVLTRDMKAGEVITPQDIMAKRPGTGISPMYIDLVIGRKLIQDCAEDTVLTWNMV